MTNEYAVSLRPRESFVAASLSVASRRSALDRRTRSSSRAWSRVMASWTTGQCCSASESGPYILRSCTRTCPSHILTNPGGRLALPRKSRPRDTASDNLGTAPGSGGVVSRAGVVLILCSGPSCSGSAAALTLRRGGRDVGWNLSLGGIHCMVGIKIVEIVLDRHKALCEFIQGVLAFHLLVLSGFR